MATASEPGTSATPKRAARFITRIPLLYRRLHETVWYEGAAENISCSGLLFRGQQRLEPFSAVEVNFPLPEEITGGAKIQVLAGGYVARVVESAVCDVGLGVAITRYQCLTEDHLSSLPLEIRRSLQVEPERAERYWNAAEAALNALVNRADQFRALVQNISDIITILEPNGTVRYQSPTLERVLGYRPEDLIGKSALDYVHPDDLPKVKAALVQTVEKPGLTVAPEFRFRHADGSWVYLDAIGDNLLSNPAIHGIVVTSRDATERRGTEDALRKQKQEQQVILDSVPAMIWYKDKENKILRVNKAAAESLGLPSDKIEGQSTYTLYPDMAARYHADDLEVINSGVPKYGIIETIRTASGENRWIRTDKIPYHDVDGNILGVIVFAVDVTERKRAEDALIASEQKLSLHVAQTPVAVIGWNLEFEVTEWNPAAERIFGYARGEAMGQHASFIVPEIARKHVEGVWKALLSRRGGTRSTNENRTQDGRLIVCEWYNTPLIDETGSVIGVTSLCQDVTERNRSEKLQGALYRIAHIASTAENLQECYPAIHSIVEELIDARNFYIALYNPATETLSFPYVRDEKGSIPTTRKLRRGMTEYVLRTQQPVLLDVAKIRELQASGEVEPSGAPSTEWLGVPLKLRNKTVGVLAVQSYTQNDCYGEEEKRILQFVSEQIASAIEHKRQEEALRESESSYRSLVENAVYGVYRVSPEGRFVKANPALVEMLGYPSEAELLQLHREAEVYANLDERKRLVEQLRIQEHVEDFEVQWKRKDGKAITVRLSGRVVRDERNQTQNLELVAEDVTERRALEEQLRQSQKMEAIGHLAGGVAHDFNNLLAVIIGYSELLAEKLTRDETLRQKAGGINKAAHRAASLTRQLLAFSRRQVLEPKVLNLNSVLSDISEMLRRLISEDIEMTTLKRADLGWVKVDRSQIEQVIMNLVVNSRDAMPRGGQLRIATSNVEVDDDWALQNARPGRYVMLEVTDSGSGMDAEIRSHLFEPFFTTKGEGIGTGLGLATVYGIIKQSNGHITVESDVGKGATFRIYLPCVENGHESPAPMEISGTAPGGAETLLLVEDEAGVRQVAREFLELKGYSVLEAANGAEALRVCEKHAGPIHLMITDVIMPGMRGPEVAKRLGAQRKGVKVLYMSGHTDGAVLQDAALDISQWFLQKPFSLDTLGRKVREILQD